MQRRRDVGRRTRLEATIKGLLAKKAPFGGTGAGLAVLGEVDFSAQYNTVDSPSALGDPYDRRVALNTQLIGPKVSGRSVLPALENVIVLGVENVEVGYPALPV
jgi:hypothetical protein